MKSPSVWTRLTAALQKPPPPEGEVGVAGTSNWSGRLHVEANPDLAWQRAYGSPGALEFGEWEKLQRTDHSVASALGLVAAPLRDTRLEVSEEYEDRDIADFVLDCFRLAEPSWPQLQEQIVAYGLGYGFSLHELVWGRRKDNRVPGGLAVVVDRFAQRLPGSVLEDGWIERDGHLSVIRQAGTRDGKWEYGIELPAEKCLLATWQRAGNNYAGVPAFRPIWYIAKMRANLLKILALGAAREALGVPSIEADKDAPPLNADQRAQLQTFIENLTAHERSGIQLPPGYRLNWIFSAGANKGSVLELWRALGLAIMETVQAQQIALGTGDTGSRAVGEVHDAAKNAFVSGVRAWLEGVLNSRDGLVHRLVDYNFGAQESYPYVSIALPESADEGGALRQWQYGMALGAVRAAGVLTVGPEDEAAVRERMGLPARDPNAPAPTDEEPGEPTDEEPGEPTNEAAKALTELLRGRVLWRALRPSEAALDLAALDDFFESGREKFEREAKPVVLDMLAATRAGVAAAMKDGDPGELEGLELDTERLREIVASFIDDAATFGRSEVRRELERGRRAELADEPRLKRRRTPRGEEPTVTFELVIPRGATDEVKRRAKGLQASLDAQIELLVSRIEQRAATALWDQAIEAVRTGRGADEAVDAVLKAFVDTKALRQDAGVVLSRSMAIGREAGMIEAGVERLEFSAILDAATCEPCRDADGTVVAAGSDEHYALMPPYARCAGGANCRCVLVPV